MLEFAVELFLIGNAFLLLGALVCLDAHPSLCNSIGAAEAGEVGNPFHRPWLPLRPIFDSLHVRLPLVWKMTDRAIQNFGWPCRIAVWRCGLGECLASAEHGEARLALPLVPQGDSREDGPGLVCDLFDLTYVSNGLDELAPALPVLGMSVC